MPPPIDLTDDELAATIAALTETLDRDRYPLSPRLEPFRAALANCPTHSAFRVADSVFAEERAKHYSREQWEAALQRAKQRTKLGDWPLITAYDF